MNITICGHAKAVKILELSPNQLDVILNEINKGEEEIQDKPKEKLLFKCQDKIEPEKKQYKPKKVACENLFIFDDMPAIYLRNPSLAKLLKVHRHSKSSVIISSQWMSDLQPQSILQLDYFIAFKSMSQEKMEKIHKLLDLSVDYEKFWEVYKRCTEEPYSFMYLSIRDEVFRCRFNKQINFES